MLSSSLIPSPLPGNPIPSVLASVLSPVECITKTVHPIFQAIRIRLIDGGEMLTAPENWTEFDERDSCLRTIHLTLSRDQCVTVRACMWMWVAIKEINCV